IVNERGMFLLVRHPWEVYRVLDPARVVELLRELLRAAAEQPDRLVIPAKTQEELGLRLESSWEQDEREARFAAYEAAGWHALDAESSKTAWAAYDQRFGASERWEPVPSCTWDISAAYDELEDNDTEPDLTGKILGAFRKVVAPGERLLVFSDDAAV